MKTGLLIMMQDRRADLLIKEKKGKEKEKKTGAVPPGFRIFVHRKVARPTCWLFSSTRVIAIGLLTGKYSATLLPVTDGN